MKDFVLVFGGLLPLASFLWGVPLGPFFFFFFILLVGSRVTYDWKGVEFRKPPLKDFVLVFGGLLPLALLLWGCLLHFLCVSVPFDIMVSSLFDLIYFCLGSHIYIIIFISVCLFLVYIRFYNCKQYMVYNNN